jgi:hypothetical protein
MRYVPDAEGRLSPIKSWAAIGNGARALVRSCRSRSCRGRHEALDRYCEVAAPIFPLDGRPHTMTVGGGLSQGRIIAAQASVLFLLLRSSFALIVEELAITAGAGGGHWMPPNPVGSCPPIIIIPNFFQPRLELSQVERGFVAGAGRVTTVVAAKLIA